MPERDEYIPGVPCWVDTSQPDADAALPFYRGLFGWDFSDAQPEGSPEHYYIANLRDRSVAAVGPLPEGMPQVATWNTYIAVADADATVEKVRAAGGEVLMPAFDVMDAGRMAVLMDPSGVPFFVWQAKVHVGAQIVNEHGSLNFNGLATRDREAAERFYGAVFGWTTLSLSAGTFWTLPGYGDHLEEHTPGLRERMAQMGAPDGFIDVVAALTPIADGDADTPPHWSVTFAADDVEATAAQARRLGATIVSEPADAPWTRTATIDDPQGARFIASQFVAENSNLVA